MEEKLKALNELYKLKEWAKVDLQASVIETSIHKGSLSISKPNAEDLQMWLSVMIDKDLLKVTPHSKQVLIRMINEICYLKDLAISLGIEE